jgi:hypothetical protein
MKGSSTMPTVKWSDTDSPKFLSLAFSERRFSDAEELIKSFIASIESTNRLVPPETAVDVLLLLRKQTWFEWLHKVAAIIRKCGQNDPEVVWHLSQALIEQKMITDAIRELQELKSDLTKKAVNISIAAEEKAKVLSKLGETIALLGRAYKQLYIDARPAVWEQRKYDLNKALSYYENAYQDRIGDYIWHGVNNLALLTHSERIRNKNRGRAIYSPAAQAIAGDVLAQIAKKFADPRYIPQAWDYANQMEANLALGKTPEALQALALYLESPDLNAFNIQSTRRQLVDIWLLIEDEEPGKTMLPMMTAKLAQIGGSGANVSLIPADYIRYEAQWGNDSYRPMTWYLKALKQARCVARLGPDQHSGFGTGFVFNGNWISQKYANMSLLLTNAHICSNDAAVRSMDPRIRAPADVKALFMGLNEDKKPEYNIKGQVWSSPPGELDATLLEIDGIPSGMEPPPLADSLPPGKGESSRLNIIGHPLGSGEPQLSLQDNQIVDIRDPKILYRTPTDGGSSGSPVFDNEWRLVALHHASLDGRMANEGILMGNIIAKMRKDLA